MMIARSALLAIALTSTLAEPGSAQPPPAPTAPGPQNPTTIPPQLVALVPSADDSWTSAANVRGWVQIVITIAAGLVAWRSFRSQREAVRLTQRADVLLEGAGIKPRYSPSVLTPDTEISLVFKNFGPTRASNVRMETDLTIEGYAQKSGRPSHPRPELGESPVLPPVVIGPNDRVRSSFAPLRRLFEDEAIQKASTGDAAMLFSATVTYTDVFDVEHHTRCKGRYYGPTTSGFIITENHEAD